MGLPAERVARHNRSPARECRENVHLNLESLQDDTKPFFESRFDIVPSSGPAQ